MKKVILKTNRLLQFAEHLRKLENYSGGYYDTIELVELESKVRIHYKLTYEMLILTQLPLAFPNDWYFHNGTAIPLLKGRTIDDGPISCFCIWFGTNAQQLCHLTDIESYQQVEMYGGTNLTLCSGPKDYAKNFEDLAIWGQKQSNLQK